MQRTPSPVGAYSAARAQTLQATSFDSVRGHFFCNISVPVTGCDVFDTGCQDNISVIFLLTPWFPLATRGRKSPGCARFTCASSYVAGLPYNSQQTPFSRYSCPRRETCTMMQGPPVARTSSQPGNVKPLLYRAAADALVLCCVCIRRHTPTMGAYIQTTQTTVKFKIEPTKTMLIPGSYAHTPSCSLSTFLFFPSAFFFFPLAAGRHSKPVSVSKTLAIEGNHKTCSTRGCGRY